MKRSLLTIVLCASAASAVLAESHASLPMADPAADRQSMMSNVGKAMAHLAAMAKGEAPYDARVADAAFRVMNTAALGFGSQFPEGSETGSETEAAPAIWSDRAGFDTAIGQFASATSAAVAAAPADLDAFKPVFGGVAGTCKSCHEGYRISKN